MYIHNGNSLFLKPFHKTALKQEYNIELEQILQLISSRIPEIQNIDVKNKETIPSHNYMFRMETDIHALRNVIGKIFQRLNYMSQLVLKGMHAFTPDLVEKAKDVLGDISNLPATYKNLEYAQNLLTTIKNKMSQVLSNKETLKQSHLWYEIETCQKTEPKITVIQSMINSIRNTQISPSHIQLIQEMSQNTVDTSKKLVKLMDEDKIQTLYQKGMYSTQNEGEITTKALREVLQNATDAVIKRHTASPDIQPTVKIYAVPHKRPDGKSYLDLIVEDNGVGMNAEILKEKFFVLGGTGKEKDTQSTGGFGVGKNVALETSEEGWSIDTKSTGGEEAQHANRAIKNFYGSQYENKKHEYSMPVPKIEQHGTTLYLYQMPDCGIYSLKEICAAYSLGTKKIQIYFNGLLVNQDFGQLISMADAQQALTETICSNDSEKKIVANKMKKNPVKTGQMTFTSVGANNENRTTTIDFYISKEKGTSTYGKSYVMLNGQYQFHETIYSSINVVCDVKTDARPGESGYPVDPSRDNLRSPYGDNVRRVVNEITQVVQDLQNSSVFRKKLEIVTINQDQEPLDTLTPDDQMEPADFEGKMEKLSPAMALFGEEQTGNKSQEEVKAEIEEKIEKEKEAIRETQEKMEDIKRLSPEDQSEKLRQLQDDMERNQQAMAILSGVAEVISQTNDPVISASKMNEIIEGIQSPCYIYVEKGFVSQDLARQKIELNKNLIIVWKSILQKVIKNLSFVDQTNRQYVPGIIYSQEALAMSAPPQPEVNQKYHCLAINPLTVAAMVCPARFEKIIKDYQKGWQQKTQTKETLDDNDSALKQSKPDVIKETPTKELTNFLFHEAVHEVTHFFFPGDDNFHRWISKIEQLSEHLFPDIYDIVKSFMSGIKEDSNNIITVMKKDMRSSKQ